MKKQEEIVRVPSNLLLIVVIYLDDGMMRGVFYCAQQLIEMDLSLASIVVNEESDLAENIVKECLFGMNKG